VADVDAPGAHDGIPEPPARKRLRRSAQPAGGTERASEDVRLVGCLAAGDEGALAMLYDRYSRPAYSLARRICVDDLLAEDVVQEVFLAVWRDPSKYVAERGAFSSWLLTLVHHKAVDAVRREGVHRRRQVAMDEETTDRLAPETPGADVDAIGAVVAKGVRDALRQLPTEQRTAMLLAYYGGYTQREVAALVGVPLGTVKSRMFAAAARLRSALGPLSADFGILSSRADGEVLR